MMQVFFAPPKPDEGDGEIIDWVEGEDEGDYMTPPTDAQQPAGPPSHCVSAEAWPPAGAVDLALSGAPANSFHEIIKHQDEPMRCHQARSNGEGCSLHCCTLSAELTCDVSRCRGILPACGDLGLQRDDRLLAAPPGHSSTEGREPG